MYTLEQQRNHIIIKDDKDSKKLEDCDKIRSHPLLLIIGASVHTNFITSN